MATATPAYLDAPDTPAAAKTADQSTEPKTTLATLRQMVTESWDLKADERTEGVVDQDYYDSKQWTAGEKKKLAERGQPDIVINRIKPAVNGIIGVVERSHTEPRAFPRNPDDEDSADTATDSLRYIADFNRFNRLKQDCFADMLIPGTMAALIGVDADGQVEIAQIRWEEHIGDPRARRRDFKDGRYEGLAKWMYADQVTALYPDKADIIAATTDGSPMPQDLAGQDRPTNNGPLCWADRKARRILVVELYYQEAMKWWRCVFVGGGILEQALSPYLDQRGRPSNPIEAQSAYVDRENNRYGVVRDMRGPQDEVNKRRSKALHLLNVRQVQVKDSMALDTDIEVARKEAAKPDGVLPPGFEFADNRASLQGHLELLVEAKAEIERFGPNPAVLGRTGEDQSGRALLARQQAGMVELALLFGGLEDWELRVYRQCWARAKQFWTEPMWIRVTDDEDAPKFVGINQPPGPPVLDPTTGQQMVHPQTQQPAFMQTQDDDGEPLPQPKHVFGLKNSVAEMDVDIILDSTPDTGTLAQEQFATLMQIIGANPNWQQQITLDQALRLSSLPHARQIIDAIKANQEEQQQAGAAQQAQVEALAKAAALANLNKTQSETTKNVASAHLDNAKAAVHVVGAHVDALDLGLNSMPQGAPADVAATFSPSPQAG
jgi:hypothetical protein